MCAAFGLAWGCFGLAWCWLWCGWGLCRSSVPTFLRVLGWLGLCGGNCYHRRCFAACRRRVGGLWSQNPPWLLGWASVVCLLGGCVGRVRLVFVCLLWCVACFCWWLGGNCYHRRCFAACRRRVGGLWSQNPPRAWSEGPASRARGGVYGRKTPRVLAQSAVHLGGMRVTWGVWGVVDDGLGVVAWGEAFSARRRVGYVGPQCVLPG